MRHAAAVIRAPNTNVTILLCATEPDQELLLTGDLALRVTM